MEPGQPIGTPLAQVRDRRPPEHPLAGQTVMRIRFQDYRAAVVYDNEIDALWLCRVVRLPDFPYPQEPNAYDHLGSLWTGGQLLPERDERKAVGFEIYWSRFIEALEEAKSRAEQSPHVWQEAIVELPKGGELRIGSAYFEEDDLGDGKAIRRFFVILKRDPAGLQRPEDWLATAAATLFEEEDDLVEPWAFAHEIPGGRGVDQNNEIALRQMSMVVHR